MDFVARADNIYHGTTKEYFKEVVSSFYNGNYRAAIVVLYSVVIADIIFKIDELSSIYGEKKATDILVDIKEMQNTNPKSAEWEMKLIKEIKNAGDFFDVGTHNNIEYLRNLRHLTAHPTFDQENELYLPNKDTVASCITNMLEGILTKPPVFIKKATDNILKDISSKKDIFLYDKEAFTKYLSATYFNHMRPNMERRVFGDIWKITFCVENEDCEENRQINYLYLTIMMERNPMDLLTDISGNKEKYSNVSFNLIGFLCRFVSRFDDIFSRLGDPAQTLIITTANKELDIKIVSHFLYDSFEKHIESLPLNHNHFKEIEFLEKRIREKRGDDISVILPYYIKLFSSCASFDSADSWFNQIIKPNLELMSASQFEELISAINDNNQLHNRMRAKGDNTLINEVAKSVLPESFEINDYPKFRFYEEQDLPDPFDDDYPFM